MVNWLRKVTQICTSALSVTMIFVLVSTAIQPEIDPCTNKSFLLSFENLSSFRSKITILELFERFPTGTPENNQSKLPLQSHSFCHQGDICHLVCIVPFKYHLPLKEDSSQEVAFFPPNEPDLDGPFQPPKKEI